MLNRTHTHQLQEAEFSIGCEKVAGNNDDDDDNLDMEWDREYWQGDPLLFQNYSGINQSCDEEGILINDPVEKLQGL